MKIYLQWLCAITLVFCANQFSQAQVITNAEINRGLGLFPGSRAFDGEPFTARYSYSLNSANIYLNGDARRLAYLDYLDRADRAEKFGYPIPIDPFFETPIEVQPQTQSPPPARVFIGGGFGIWRRR